MRWRNGHHQLARRLTLHDTPHFLALRDRPWCDHGAGVAGGAVPVKWRRVGTRVDVCVAVPAGAEAEVRVGDLDREPPDVVHRLTAADVRIRDPFQLTVPERRTSCLFGSTNPDIWKPPATGIDCECSGDLGYWEVSVDAF